MKYFLESSSGRKFEVDLEHQPPSSYRLRIDGRVVDAELVDVDQQGQYAARVGCRSFAASIDQRGEQDLLVTLGGECFILRATDERERAAGALGKGRRRPELIKAAMPGIVVGLRVAVGDQVEAGQPVLVLEAMKMQNEVCAEHRGVVESIECAAGQAVAGGEVLVRLRPAAE